MTSQGLFVHRPSGDTRVAGAALSDGSEIDVEFVFVGVGITPLTLLAKETGPVETWRQVAVLERSSMLDLLTNNANVFETDEAFT